MDVVLPGGRDARGTLDRTDAESVVVACPPHPQYGGNRSDSRLVAVSDALREEGIDCLRFDYGGWDEGRGEQADVKSAVRWAGERYDWVGLFGFSFGGTMALCAASEIENLRAVCALAPDSGGKESDAVAALDAIDYPVQVLYAERDTTAEWEPVVERARELDFHVEALSADHFFVGQSAKVAKRVASFLVERL